MLLHSSIFLLLIVGAFCQQVAPGTVSRPVLTSAEAQSFSVASYLQDWTPPAISTNTADYVVGSGCYPTIQSAVNAAINDGGTVRKYIRITKGTYNEVVYIPMTTVPLTLYGSGDSPSDTLISLSLRAQATTSQYEDIVNPGGYRFRSEDPAYDMYQSCASRNGTIGTSCTGVFRIQSNDVQISSLSIENNIRDAGESQAVALQTRSDRIQIDNVRLLGYQDTLYTGKNSEELQRHHLTNSYISGDVDFVFGGGTAVFENCTFYVSADRRNKSAIVFAPSTDPSVRYGYLVIRSRITGGATWLTTRKARLARAWDASVPSLGDYVVGTSPNGQLTIRETVIDGIVPVTAPYNNATSGRPYSGNIAENRNVNDNNFNRFWEYANTGAGS